MTTCDRITVNVNDVFDHLSRGNYDVTRVPEGLNIPSELPSRVLYVMLAARDLRPDTLYENLHGRSPYLLDACTRSRTINAHLNMDDQLAAAAATLPGVRAAVEKDTLDDVLRALAPAVHADILAAVTALTGTSVTSIDDIALHGDLRY